MTQAQSSIKTYQQQLKKQKELQQITHNIHKALDIEEILLFLKDEILRFFNVERVTIYAAEIDKAELFSMSMEGSEIKEIRLPLDATSIAGAAAVENRILNIGNVRDAAEMNTVQKGVVFDETWDIITGFRTVQVLTGPVYHETLLKGVVQLINTKTKTPFDKEDEVYLSEICKVLGLAMHNKARRAARKTKFDYLLSHHLLSEADLNKAIAIGRKTNRNIVDVLLQDLKVAKSDIGKSYEQYYNTQFVEFDEKAIFPKGLVRGLNRGYLKKNGWTPFSEEGDTLSILIDDPENKEKIKEINMLLPGRQIVFLVGLPEDIQQYIDLAFGETTRIVTPAVDQEPSKPEMRTVSAEEDERVDEGLLTEEAADVVQLVNNIIRDAYTAGASDIHIEQNVGRKNARVRFRKDGACTEYRRVPGSHALPMISRVKIMSNLDIAERRLPQSGKIRLHYGNKEVELRVEVTPIAGGLENVVLRILASGKPLPLNRMGFSPANLRKLIDIMEKPYGMILCVGPTGSGKTTTLHGILGHLNRPDVKIWTAEDPVEITQEGLCQVQTRPKIGYTFAAAMRSFLRADPDIIMVGEMRDQETAQIGIEASLTGHLVLSTLHTNSAPETITRLIDMNMNPFNFADSLLGVLAQRLVRTLCADCKEAYRPSADEYKNLKELYGSEYFHELDRPHGPEVKLYRAKGCEKCNHTGYAGRTAIHELLVASPTIKRLIQEKAPMGEVRTAAVAEGMRTLRQDGIRKVLAGETDLLQVRKVCIE